MVDVESSRLNIMEDSTATRDNRFQQLCSSNLAAKCLTIFLALFHEFHDSELGQHKQNTGSNNQDNPIYWIMCCLSENSLLQPQTV